MPLFLSCLVVMDHVKERSHKKNKNVLNNDKPKFPPHRKPHTETSCLNYDLFDDSRNYDDKATKKQSFIDADMVTLGALITEHPHTIINIGK